MRIVTGYRGENHITANDWQALNKGIFGAYSLVFMSAGHEFRATFVDSTHIQIEDGEGVMQGVYFRIDRGEIDTIAIDSGTPGMNRIDLIVARYIKDVETGIESVDLAVIKGEETAGIPQEPTYIVGDIINGDNLSEFPLYKITFTDITPAITKAYTVVETIKSLSSNLDSVLGLFMSKNMFSIYEDSEAIASESAGYISFPIPRMSSSGRFFNFIVLSAEVTLDYADISKGAIAWLAPGEYDNGVKVHLSISRDDNNGDGFVSLSIYNARQSNVLAGARIFVLRYIPNEFPPI